MNVVTAAGLVGPVSITQETVGDPAYLPLCNDLLGMGATHESEVGLLYSAGSPTFRASW